MRISRPFWIVSLLGVVLGCVVGLELGRAEGLRIINQPNYLGPSIPRPLTNQQFESKQFTVNMLSWLGAFAGVLCVACPLGLAYVGVSLTQLWRRANRPPDKVLQMTDIGPERP